MLFVSDIDDEQSVKSLAETMMKQYGGIDSLVNNAGICYMKNEISADEGNES